ncbi:hypothetical protein, partial [Burkholderia pseudomultivorans]|uniref:hypothetical protein n=1 Tax=Burkholderia pseudomultivorans TaxID=1207504 RepID=UPI0028709A0D
VLERDDVSGRRRPPEAIADGRSWPSAPNARACSSAGLTVGRSSIDIPFASERRPARAAPMVRGRFGDNACAAGTAMGARRHP